MIDHDAVADMLLGVDLVIAHNAAFDRPFCEALHPAFSHLSWACSVDEVDGAAAGFDGAELGHLLLQAGSTTAIARSTTATPCCTCCASR